jgi:hypothetical protein
LHIVDWIQVPYLLPNNQALMIQVRVQNLVSLVYRALYFGVWTQPQNCDMIWQRMRDLIIMPLFATISTDHRLPGLQVSDGDISILVKYQDPVTGEWDVCSEQQFVDMLELRLPNI